MGRLTLKVDKKKFFEMAKQMFDEDTMMEIAKMFADYLEEAEAYKFPPRDDLVTDPDRVLGVVRIGYDYYKYAEDYTKVLKVKFKNGNVVKYVEADETDMKTVEGDDITAVRVGKTYVNKDYLDKACRLLSVLHNMRFKRNDYSRFTILYPKEPDNPLIVAYGNIAVFIAPLVTDEFIEKRGG
ncbi:MAG: hypothetical protein DRG33_02640 [Deltaproteobacteria bacterium]|nr:MAG: hypothetical protein DRG33_02640 [Deltaproteobacteria bacterium]